jgi:uridine monophosphate synthetase
MDQKLASRIPAMLYGVGAVKIDTEKGFPLKLHESKPEAPLSPIYLNLRTPKNPKRGPLGPHEVKAIGKELYRHAQKCRIFYTAIAGLPHAGTPLAKAFAQAVYDDGSYVPIVRLGKMTDEGGKRRIGGVLDDNGAMRGDRVLVIDDLITEGHSKLEGIEELRRAGFEVKDVLVLVDREQGGAADLAKAGVRLWSLFTLQKVVDELASLGKIPPAERDMVLEYLSKNS